MGRVLRKLSFITVERPRMVEPQFRPPWGAAAVNVLGIVVEDIDGPAVLVLCLGRFDDGREEVSACSAPCPVPRR